MRIDTRIVLAGLAGYVIAAGAADLCNPDWNPAERMVSHYVHARAGWLIPVALLSLSIASAALWRTTASRPGRWLLGIWTVCVLLGGIFPTDPPGQWDRPPTPAGLIHGVAGLTAFVVLPIAAVVLARTRMLKVFAAITVATLLVFVVAFVDVMDGPTLNIVGLTERVMLWSYVGWLAAAAVTGRRSAAGEPAQATRRASALGDSRPPAVVDSSEERTAPSR